MLNTSFCRCKRLLKLPKGAFNTDLSHKIDSRYYGSKIIYSSQSPHESISYKSENDSEHGQMIDNEFNYQELYKEPVRKDTSHKVKSERKRTVEKNKSFKEKNSAPSKVFDTTYAFLDHTKKVKIKPTSPLQRDELGNFKQDTLYGIPYEESNFKRAKLYKRNFKITDNSLFQSEISNEQDKKENKSIQLQNDQADRIIQDNSTKKLRQKYSFDSNLVIQGDTEDTSSILEIANTSTENEITKCVVDTAATNCNDSNLSQTDLKPRFKTIDSPEGQITLNLADDEFDINDFVKEFNEKIPGPLDECREDISYFGPDFSPTFNFAAYADKSNLIQQYVKLGVKLYKVEKNMDHMRALLTVDLEKELPMYIQFLHDCGIPANCLGDAITECPMILKEDIDDMKTRIRYLRAHNFTPGSIARIVTKNPTWLIWATKFIDERLGHYQNEFKLGGSEMRFLATKAPKLITYPMRHINENTFAVREQMGFKPMEMKLLLLYKPRLWMNSRKKIVDSFDYLHNTMKLSHVMIASQADVMTTRKCRLKNRHEFLVELKKAQYDPKKPGYIAPKSMVVGSDVEFCTKIAKTAVDTYNLFLKTR